MGWDELHTRASQEIAKRWDAVLYRLGARFYGKGASPIQEAPARFFFAPEELPEIIALLRERLPDEVERIKERARRLCQHRFDLLGYSDLGYGEPIDWHLDVVNGKRAPRKPWYRIPFLDFNAVGDSKITWELNRHQHWVTLAKAYRLTGDERFAAEVYRQWYHWQQENPYPIGINWASSLEVAFRSLSWLWVRHLLADCPVMPETFTGDLTQALALNGRHIERYLSTYFSPNTHLIGEGVALFFIGVLCPRIPTATRWQRLGWNIVLREAHRQVQPDGMHFEQSIYYHIYTLDFFLHARILAAANQLPIAAELDRTLVRMLHLLCVLSQVGPPPRLGDDDGGRVFDPQRNRAEHLLDPLTTGAVLFDRADFKATAGGLREETLWLLGPRGVAVFDRLPNTRPQPTSASFPASGIYVTASGEPMPRQLVIDAGPMGVNTAGHSHADALSVHLCVDGREWLTDPGTGAYVSSEQERDLFRSTSAHNTLQVDGTPQAEPNGPFAWGSRPEVKAESWVAGETFDLFVGSHTGYCRLPRPVVHRRWVFHAKSRFWLVRDVALGDPVSTLDLAWHLAPGSVTRSQNANVTAQSTCDPQGLAFLTVEGHDWTQEITNEWWSPTYGSKQLSPVLRFRKRTQLPAEFLTLLRPLADNSVELGRLEEITDSRKNAPVRGYRYSTPQEIHLVFFGQGERWELAGWASDASVLYCQASPNNDLRHVVFCGGSFVESGGQRLFAAKRKVARCEWRGEEATRQLFCSDEDALLCLPGEVLAEAEPVLRGGKPQDPRGGER